MKTSESLVAGEIYTRKRLKEMFGVQDATINTGTFRPKGHESVWLFVTEKKTADQTPYHDLLDNDILYWDGQASDLDSLETEEEYFEGTKRKRFVNYYERDKKLRAAAVEHHGVTCKVCHFNFEEAYGERGRDYVEAHHLIPVSSLGEKTKVDPKSDMTVLCSNCHRMVHRKKDHVLTPEELKRALRK